MKRSFLLLLLFSENKGRQLHVGTRNEKRGFIEVNPLEYSFVREILTETKKDIQFLDLSPYIILLGVRSLTCWTGDQFKDGTQATLWDPLSK